MSELPHVLWIGGPPGCGKTSIGRWLAHRYDLQAYNADAHTWEHHDRSLARGDPVAARWEALSPDERWVATTPAEMAELSLELNTERFRNMVDDVARLPVEPMIVMEGTPLLPWLVAEFLADPRNAVWLLPTPAFQRARLLERPVTAWATTSHPAAAIENRIERERLVGEAIGRSATERGLRTLRVDETRDLETMKALVEGAFRVALAGAAPLGRHVLRTVRRRENAAVLAQVRTYLERVPAAGAPESYGVELSCECGKSGCGLQPTTTVVAYERLVADDGVLVAREHR